MKTITYVGVVGAASALLLAAWINTPQGRSPVTSTAAQVETRETEGGESGCSGCFCCFPRTPDGNVSLDGFVGTGEEIVYTVPHGKWFLATDIEVIALDATGSPVADHAVGIFEVDTTGMHGGMRMMKRWANCSPYHSARGIPFMPMCDVVLDAISTSSAPRAGKAARVYYQINGYLWDDSGSHSGH